MGVPGAGHGAGDPSLLTRRQLRGTHELCQFASVAAARALSAAGVDVQDCVVVFGSAFGEIATADGLCHSHRLAEPSSPLRFRNSVHNTWVGLLGVATGSMRPSTSIAAGQETTQMALLEAQTLLYSGYDTVLVVVGDEFIPDRFECDLTYESMVAALVLTRSSTKRRSLVMSPLKYVGGQASDSVRKTESPCAPMIHLVSCIEAHKLGEVELGEGSQATWSVELREGQTP